jgi:hypothetical protein
MACSLEELSGIIFIQVPSFVLFVVLTGLAPQRKNNGIPVLFFAWENGFVHAYIIISTR